MMRSTTALRLAAALGGVLVGSACLDDRNFRVTEVRITLDSLRLAPLGTQQLTAVTLDQHGQVMSRPITWSVKDTAIARISPVGRVTAVTAGFTLVTAAVEGVLDTMLLIVAPRVLVAPEFPSLFTGDTLQLDGDVQDALGDPWPGTVVWGSSNAAVAQVSPAGLMTAVAPGTARITAQSEGGETTLDVVVLPAPGRPIRDLLFLRSRGGSSRSIWLLPPGTTVAQRLFPSDSMPLAIDWSPDGSRIVASLLRGPATSGTFVLTLPAVEQRILAVTTGSLAWSPDGTRIAYISNNALRTVTPDGLNQVQVSPATGAIVWSPDGRQLLFYSMLYSGHRLARSDGTQRALAIPGGVLYGASWSPDGKRLLVAGETQLWMLRGDGASPQPFCPVALGCVPAGLLRWSPDGSRILLSTASGLVIVTADGASVTSANPPGCVNCPFEGAWSPDGTVVAFAAEVAPDTAGIWLVNADGTNPRVIASVPGSVGGLRWRP